MTFTLSITLGNAAMLTAWDVANALRQVADRVALAGDVEVTADCTGSVRDANGNRVGEYAAVADEVKA